ncbi:unnamed protein product [Acanthosepion pharaonis]|uniref:Uncharacterized protein n=1 Tax=Acanthosepion pharaonis TaxID=158019 RepID=A0A812DJB6_ACAPH|nr:unnamed protein product [Sepia pharaonis]
MGHPTESHRLDVRLTALSHGSIRVCQRFFSLPMSFFLFLFYFKFNSFLYCISLILPPHSTFLPYFRIIYSLFSRFSSFLSFNYIFFLFIFHFVVISSFSLSYIKVFSCDILFLSTQFFFLLFYFVYFHYFSILHCCFTHSCLHALFFLASFILLYSSFHFLISLNILVFFLYFSLYFQHLYISPPPLISFFSFLHQSDSELDSSNTGTIA